LVWVVGLLISAKRILTLEVCGDWPKRLERWEECRSTGVAVVAMVARPIGVAFFARLAMAMVVGDHCEGLTFKRSRRLIQQMKDER
jgi:hypothetical protein